MGKEGGWGGGGIGAWSPCFSLDWNADLIALYFGPDNFRISYSKRVFLFVGAGKFHCHLQPAALFHGFPYHPRSKQLYGKNNFPCQTQRLENDTTNRGKLSLQAFLLALDCILSRYLDVWTKSIGTSERGRGEKGWGRDWPNHLTPTPRIASFYSYQSPWVFSKMAARKTAKSAKATASYATKHAGALSVIALQENTSQMWSKQKRVAEPQFRAGPITKAKARVHGALKRMEHGTDRYFFITLSYE